jgi:predicted permease
MSPERRRRLYRSLIRIFPRDFRQRHQAQLEQLFSDLCDERTNQAESLGPRFWVPLVWDTGLEAGCEWARVCREAIAPILTKPMGESMSSFFSDVRIAMRQLVRNRTYAVTVIVLMAVGIAGNAAVFRVFNGLFLKPLPFESPEELVDLDETAPEWELDFLNISYRDFETWRAENSTFQSMTVFEEVGGNFLAGGAPRRVSFLRTSHDIDEVLRLAPHLGRFYGPGEDHPDSPQTMMISQGFWQQEFAGNPDVLGRTVRLNGYPVEIIGVLPSEARFLGDFQMWLPLRENRSEWRGWGLSGIGRLKPGVTIQRAQEDLTTIHKGMIPEFDVNEVSSPVVSSLNERFLGEFRLGSGLLMAAVGIVLLIACANIAGLMFVRALARGPEMALRAALGAPRRRVVQQLLTEGLVLGVLGAGAGVVLGIWGSDVLVAPMAEQFPAWVSFDLDARFMLFTIGVTIMAALLFGLAPALHASRGDGAAGGGGRATGGRSHRRGMSALVTGEVALAMVLLVVGGLSVLDVRELGRMDPGFEADGLLSYSLNLPTTRYENSAARLAFVDEYLARLEAIPGVEAAASASNMPLGGHDGTLFMIDGAPPRLEEEANPIVLSRVVTPGYFETAGVRFVVGRPFDDFDGREDGGRAIIVNERFVETHLSHLDDPLGAQVVEGPGVGDDPNWMTVVGVTKNVRHHGVDVDVRPGVYRPYRQHARTQFSIALRVRGESAPVIAQARAITTDMDVELPVYGVQVMSERLDQALWTRRATSWLIGAFSAVALALAIAGIYGVISFSVGQRTQEISIRMAMGAQRGEVLGEVLRSGMALVLMGVVLGLLISFAGSGAVSGILVGVDSTEPIVYVIVTTLLIVVAAVANYLPARRAASIDPMNALRGE